MLIWSGRCVAVCWLAGRRSVVECFPVYLTHRSPVAAVQTTTAAPAHAPSGRPAHGALTSLARTVRLVRHRRRRTSDTAGARQAGYWVQLFTLGSVTVRPCKPGFRRRASGRASSSVGRAAFDAADIDFSRCVRAEKRCDYGAGAVRRQPASVARARADRRTLQYTHYELLSRRHVFFDEADQPWRQTSSNVSFFFRAQ